ncbi:MAG: SDR family oxidoreductase [Deltaproteobacteria bacterium]
MTNAGQQFRNHEILLTGANGFLGKVVVGMLAERYPDFKHLHILLRSQGELSAKERFEQQTLASPAFSTQTKPLPRSEISVWAGDVGVPMCGLDAPALERLTGRVSLIINCAGLVEFFPSLDQSFRSNVDGVEHVVALAKRLSARLLHVSTCYVCGDREGLVEESEPIRGFYPHRKGLDDTSFDHVEELRHARERIRHIYETTSTSESNRRELTERLVALGRQRSRNWGWVNTYTYAKSLGEQIIASEPDLDYTIVRPPIVESALQFPFPGWIEGGRTAAPLVLMALGGLKDWPVRKDIPLEIAPVDQIAAAVLMVGALALDLSADGRAKVYQLGTADTNPFELEPLVSLLDVESRRAANKRKNGGSFLIDPSGRMRFLTAEQARARRAKLRKRIERTQNAIGGAIKFLDSAHLPGRSALSAWSMGLRSLSLQTNFREQVLDQYLPFILHNRYIFESVNIRLARSQMTERDRELLPWLPERIDWKDYWVNQQVKGIQKWIQPEAVRDWAFKI